MCFTYYISKGHMCHLFASREDSRCAPVMFHFPFVVYNYHTLYPAVRELVDIVFTMTNKKGFGFWLDETDPQIDTVVLLVSKLLLKRTSAQRWLVSKLQGTKRRCMNASSIWWCGVVGSSAPADINYKTKESEGRNRNEVRDSRQTTQISLR